MRPTAYIVALALVPGLTAGLSRAMTLTNTDDVQHSVTIVVGERETDRELAAGKAMKVNCRPDCIIRIGGWDGQLVAEDRDDLVISGGEAQKRQR